MSSNIILKNVSFHRGARCIFDNISIDIPTGKITTILGPSGTGKTTLLQLIAGLLLPSSGEIHYANHTICRTTSEKKLKSIRKKMGFLFQTGALFSQMNVYDNISFPILQNTNLPKNIIKNIVLMKLEAVGLAHTINMIPSELSGGMARRVALARSIALDPEIMMYDEPFTGQDPTSFNTILNLIKTLNTTLGMTSLLVSHDIEEAMNISDNIIIVANKTVIANDTPENIRKSNNQTIKDFINGNYYESKKEQSNTNSDFFIKELLS